MRVLGWVGLALVMLGAVSVTAMALTASHGKVPPSKPLAVALHDAATAAPPTGVTARFAVHQHLIPGSSTLLSTGPLAGATGTVWAADGKVRLSIHSALGSTQLAYDGSSLTFYNPKNHAAYRLALPSHERGKSLCRPGMRLRRWATSASCLPASGTTRCFRERSRATSPDAPPTRSRCGRASLRAWSARWPWPGTPHTACRCASRSRRAAQSTPALELVVTDIRFGKLPAGATSLTLPAGTHTERRCTCPRSSSLQGAAKHVHSVTGAGAVAKAVQFHLTAPATLAGRARTEVRSLGDGALIVYGKGLDSLLVYEKRAGGQGGVALPAMSPVSVNGAAGHEIETTLGSILQFSSGRVTYTVAGFQTADTILSAAQSLH